MEHIINDSIISLPVCIVIATGCFPLIDAADEKKVTLLALLDMSSAFDTVDFQILLHRLKVSYGLEWTVRYYSGFCQTELILSRSLVVVPLLPNWTVEYPRAQYLAP